MYLFISILLGFLIFLFISTRKIHWAMKILLIFLLFILSLITFIFMFIPPDASLIRSSEDIDPSVRVVLLAWSLYMIAPWKHFILFIFMLLGMMTNYFFEYFQARIKAKESEGQVQLPKFIWEKLVLPLLIAGILFGYFWGQHSKEPMGLTIIFISYQNGFFWQTILEKIK